MIAIAKFGDRDLTIALNAAEEATATNEVKTALVALAALAAPAAPAALVALVNFK